MSLATTMRADRLQIAIFGRRNAGKSSLINAMTGQDIAIVSDVKGTTTDPVSKAMEILPLGPCMLIDTPGLDDEGQLGKKRIEKTMQVLDKTDIAIVVVDAVLFFRRQEGRLSAEEENILTLVRKKSLPAVIALNRIDCLSAEERKKTALQTNLPGDIPVCFVSAATGENIERLKDEIIRLAPDTEKNLGLVGDLIGEGQNAVLVTPIDSAAPKGRLIMPQQQVIRDVLDHHGIAIVTQPNGLAQTLENLRGKVKVVITDSQAFGEVSAMVPKDILLTSFSILFARRKGDLRTLVQGVAALKNLKDKDNVLIAEGCTHKRQCDDIGTVKIPRWLTEHTGKKLKITTVSGADFPADLSPFSLVIHCGGCTLTEKEMRNRSDACLAQNVPMTNYGLFIAQVHGVLARSLEPFPEISTLIDG